MKKNLISSIIAILAVVFSFNTYAEDSAKKISDISIKEEAFIRVTPDIFTATVEFSNEDLSSEYAQQEVNRQVSEAIKIIEKSKKIKHNVKSFSIYKKYKSKRFTASQSIFLESGDIKELENIVTKLQRSHGKVTSTNSSIKDTSSQKYFETLFKEAYEKAIKKAKFITKTLDGKDFEITKVNYYINEERPRLYARNAMMNNAMDESSNNINMDGNKNKIQIVFNMSIAILTK